MKITVRVLGLAELARLDATRLAERLFRDRASALDPEVVMVNREMVSRQS